MGCLFSALASDRRTSIGTANPGNYGIWNLETRINDRVIFCSADFGCQSAQRRADIVLGLIFEPYGDVLHKLHETRVIADNIEVGMFVDFPGVG